MKPYEYGDRLYKQAEKAIKQLFQHNRLMDFDEINAVKVSKSVRRLYTGIDNIIRAYYLRMLKQLYKDRPGYLRDLYWEDEEDFIEDWLDKTLEGYDGVTKYVYTHEFDRKRARLYESLMADKQTHDRLGVDKDYATAQRYVLGQVKQYFVDLEDSFVKKMFEDAGLDEVEWFTQKDERVCESCGPMHGLIFPIDRVPNKPHIGCRCYIRAVQIKQRSGD